MAYMAVTEEVIAAIKSLRLRVIELHGDLIDAQKKLANKFEENEQGLGSSSSVQDIRRLLEELGEYGSQDASSPVKKLTRRLKISARVREEEINGSNHNKR